MRYDGLRSASTQIAFPIVRPKNMDGLMADAMMVFLWAPLKDGPQMGMHSAKVFLIIQ